MKLWACWLQKRTCVLKENVLLFQPSTKCSWAHSVPKVNQFLSKIPPISHTFVKQYWTFNITQSLGMRRKFLTFLKLNSHLKFSWWFVFLIAAALAFHRFIWWSSAAQSSEPAQRTVDKKSQNNTNNQKMMQKKEQEVYSALQGQHS